MNCIRNDLHSKGVVLFIVLTLFAVVSILGIAFSAMGLIDLTETQNTDKRVKAHYLALSGIEMARGVLGSFKNRNIQGIFYGKFNSDLLSEASLTFEDISSLGESFTYDNLKIFLKDREIPEDNNIVFGILRNEENEIKICSFGCLNDVRRSVTLQLIPAGVPTGIFDMTIFGIDSVSSIGQANISGKVGSNSTETGQISFSSNSTFDGTVCIIDPENNAGVVDSTFIPVLEELEKPRNYEVPVFPDFSLTDELAVDNAVQLTINSDGGYSLIEINPDGELIIDTTEKQDIVVSCVDLKSLGKITVKGSGIVWLYVSGTINLDDVISDEGGTLILVYSGTSQISVSGQIAIESFGLYCPLADVDLGGQMGLSGAIIAKTAKIGGLSEVEYCFSYSESLGLLAFPTSRIDNYAEIWSE